MAVMSVPCVHLFTAGHVWASPRMPAPSAEKIGAPDGPVQRERVRMGEPGAAHRVVGVGRHGEERERLQRAEEAAEGQPVPGHPDPVVVVRRAQDPGDERQADDHVQPLLHHLAVDSGEPDQEVGEQPALDHLPDALDPEVHRPPPIEDAHRVVVELEERGQVQERRCRRGRRPAPPRSS